MIYELGGNQPTDENQSIDLLQFMPDKKNQTQKFIIERVAERLRKVQLSANLGLIKSRAIITSSNTEPAERNGVYANSDTKPVMSLELEDEPFCEYKQFQKVLHLMEAAGFCNTSYKFLLHLLRFFESTGHHILTILFEKENPRI